MTAALRSEAPASPWVREARAEDNAEIRELLRRPMDGLIRVALTREPDASIAIGIEGPRHSTVVIRDENNRLLGVGARAVRKRFYRGRSVFVGYLGQLRAQPGAVGLKRLQAGFAHLAATRRRDELPFDITTIASDNAPAARLLLAGLPGLPRYEPIGSIETLVVKAGGRNPKSGVRAARESDREAIAGMLREQGRRSAFGVDWSLSELDAYDNLSLGDFAIVEDSRGLRAVGAVWDQRPFKQVMIHDYRPWLRRLRLLINPGLALAGQPTLPPPGSTLPMGYLSHFAVRDDDDHAGAAAIIRFQAARAKARGLEQLAFALASKHPLVSELRRRFRPRLYRSQICLVHWDDTSTALPPDASLNIEAAIL